jgi:hypothetical protein
MNRSDRQAWQSARSLADLGELTAQWIEGTIGEQPGYCGPSDLDDPERLVPVCTALCRAGFVTTQSQEAFDGAGYDGAHWEQRAAVEGFATGEMAARLLAVAYRNRLCVISHGPSTLPRWGVRYGTAVAVTRRAGRDYTGFGTLLSRGHVRGVYGDLHPDAVGAVCSAWQVTVIDPAWGRPGALWRVLQDVIVPGPAEAPPEPGLSPE